MLDDIQLTSSGRPKRATRAPNREVYDAYTTASSSAETYPPRGAKRRLVHDERDIEGHDRGDTIKDLEALLRNPKSILTRMNISDLLNMNTWNMLPHASQTMLSALLPPTAFIDYEPSIEPSPANISSTLSLASSSLTSASSNLSPVLAAADVSSSLSSPHTPALLSPSFFTDAHFLSAAHTFQDQLFSSQLTASSAAALCAWIKDVRSGQIHSPWKDEVWQRDHEFSTDADDRAGQAAELKLPALAANGILKVGDLLVYKRNFSALPLVVEKDVMIQAIHPKTHALSVLVPPETAIHLPDALLSSACSDSTHAGFSLNASWNLRQAVVTSPSQLESAILDVDGRVERGRRPNGNAWKSLTVWRERSNSGGTDVEGAHRGRRENHGTLFYLRGCFYQDR